MADELPRPVPRITLQLDRERHLVLSLTAAYLAEQELRKIHGPGYNLMRAYQQGQLGITEILTLLWAMLRREDKALTIEQVGDLIHAGNFERIKDAVLSAVVEHAVTGEPPASQNGRGGAPPEEEGSPSGESTGSASGREPESTSASVPPNSGI
jgi:hypothetical protein